MVFKVAILQMRSENRAYEDNIKMIIKNMTEAKIILIESIVPTLISTTAVTLPGGLTNSRQCRRRRLSRKR